ncbi:MAG: hypothetical protein ACXVZJ_11150 [Terriglobales bacterium]
MMAMAASFARSPGQSALGYHVAAGNAVMDLTGARAGRRASLLRHEDRKAALVGRLRGQLDKL